MNINNQQTNVPSQVRDLLLSEIPFGSEYVVFCSENSQSRQVYDCYYKKVGSSDLYHKQVVHTQSGYSLSDISESNSYDGFSVQNPYYAVSSVEGQGVYYSLPSSQSLITLLLIVIASCIVLRTVFGGIKLWSNRRRKYL